MFKDYIRLDIGKIVIIYKGKTKNYYKEVKGELLELTKSELEYINKIFNKENDYIYHNEGLKELIKNNDKINHKDYITPLLLFLDKIIPEGYKENFYNNVKGLTLELDLNCDLSKLPARNKSTIISCAEYFIKDNKLVIYNEFLRNTKELADKLKNKGIDPEDYYNRALKNAILHELIHMASTKYDKVTGKASIGFDRIPIEDEEDKNTGLTEGMTQAIANFSVNIYSAPASYYIEVLIANQLCLILNDEMFKSFFGNKRIKVLEEKLNDLINDSEKSYNLFRRIEDNYQIRHMDCEQTLLGSIQSSLVEYLEVKMEKSLEDGSMTYSEIANYLKNYETALITPKTIEQTLKNPSNYIGLEDSVQSFYKVRNKIMDKITTKIMIDESIDINNDIENKNSNKN